MNPKHSLFLSQHSFISLKPLYKTYLTQIIFLLIIINQKAHLRSYLQDTSIFIAKDLQYLKNPSINNISMFPSLKIFNIKSHFTKATSPFFNNIFSKHIAIHHPSCYEQFKKNNYLPNEIEINEWREEGKERGEGWEKMNRVAIFAAERIERCGISWRRARQKEGRVKKGGKDRAICDNVEWKEADATTMPKKMDKVQKQWHSFRELTPWLYRRW